jgi:hypothetical protein
VVDHNINSRNSLVNPEMMVERAQAKRDAVDTTKAAVDGLKIGLLIVGPVVAVGTYLDSNDLLRAAANYGKFHPRETNKSVNTYIYMCIYVYANTVSAKPHFVLTDVFVLMDVALLGGGIGGILAANNYMGKGIHVPDIPEATNRIIVDLSEGLLRKQDTGFVAVSDGKYTTSTTSWYLYR